MAHVPTSILLVYAHRDAQRAARVCAALETRGGSVVRRAVPVPDLDPPDEPYDGPEPDRVVVLFSPWLMASGWASGAEGRRWRSRTAVVLDPHFPLDVSELSLCPRVPPDAPADAIAVPLIAVDAVAPPGLEEPRASRAARAFALAWLDAHHGAADRELKTRLEQALGRLEPGVYPGALLAGRWRLVERAGIGPWASVWRAADSQGGWVAVKALHPQWVGTDEEQRFLDAGRAAQAIRDDGLAPVLHVQVEPSFAVRPWAPQTLQDRIVAGDLGMAEALQAILDVGRGLAALHRSGAVHGNLRPSNVLLFEGRAVLADFRGEHPSGAGASNVLYMAPETQEPGEERRPVSDVYLLGMSALAALHRGALPLWVLRDPERLIIGLDVPEAVKDTIRSALDWDPAARCPSVEAFERGLLQDGSVVRVLCEFAASTGRHEVVASYLAQLLRGDGERSPAALIALGRAHLAAGDIDAARSAFEEASLSAVRAEALAAARGLADVEAATGGDKVEDLLARATIFEPVGVELLVDAARCLEANTEAARPVWEKVLEHHLTAEQAEEALAWLVEDAERRRDWAERFRLGALRHGFLPRDIQGEEAYRLGCIAMDRLQEPARALPWLQRAVECGYDADDLPARLETIRSARGEWRQVVALMLERAEKLDDPDAVALLLRAARVALYAHNHHEDAARIMLQVLMRDPENRVALRFLARYHARARRDERALALYARLAPHEDRVRDGESAETRVSDNVDYARILLRNDRPRGAQLCLEAALDRNPHHIPTLALTSQLAFDLGKWDEARVAAQGLVRAYASAEPEQTFCAALRRLGDLDWLHGDLIGASHHYNRVLELRPDDAGSWWGRAKIALAGHAGRLEHALSEEMPWLTAAPVRYTPHEALARLLAGLLQPEALRRWMALDPLGAAMVELVDGEDALVLAAAAVDLMEARQLVRGDLFQRLLRGRPAWERPIRAVEALWFSPGGAPAFPVGESYRWSGMEVDFDPRHHREILYHARDPDEPSAVRPSLASLHHASAWKVLLEGEGRFPEPPTVDEDAAEPVLQRRRTAVLVLTLDGLEGPQRKVIRIGDGEIIGSAAGDVTLPLATLEPEHLRFDTVGDYVYVHALGPLEIDGEPVVHRRLFGGESLKIGPVMARFHWEDELAVDEGGAEECFELDAPRTHAVKAALFYVGPDGRERMLPVVGSRVEVYQDPEGVLTMGRGGGEAAVRLFQHQGGFSIQLPGEDAAVPLEHLHNFVVGTTPVQFRRLDRSEVVEPGVPALVVDDGLGTDRTVPMDGERLTLGRGRDADIQVASDASLSRIHCVFTRDDGRTWLEDLGSSNGTLVNGVPAEGRVQLMHGDVIVAGQTRIRYLEPETSDGSLHDFGVDDPTEQVPVRAIARCGLPIEEAREKVRVVNQALRAICDALDRHEGPGRGQALLENLVAARPRSYHGLLDDLEVGDGLPEMELLYNVFQRPAFEQRPLLNFVLLDLIERSVEQVVELLPDEAVDDLLTRLAGLRYRDRLRLVP